ncbi:MAG: T9SS type A sorting domain-containing protein [Ignavibacteria bacterium]
MLQNYPNPFNPETIISYNLSSDSEVELVVYNILGKRIAELVKEK